MKHTLLFSLFLLLPNLVFCQSKKFYSEYMVGYELSGKKTYSMRIPRPTGSSGRTMGNIQSIRFGYNANYALTNSFHISSGLKLSYRTFHYLTEIDFLLFSMIPTPKKNRDFYLEVPFRLRYFYANKTNTPRFYMEGGVSYNQYLASYRGALSEQTFGKLDYYNDGVLMWNFALGSELRFRDGKMPNLFQFIFRSQLTPSLKDSATRNGFNSKYIHIGFEWIIRF